MSPNQILSIFILIFFTPTIIFSVRTCLRNGIGVQFGWLYLLLLAVFRVVGAALQIASGDDSWGGLGTAASVISSIGVMTLLLAMLEIIMMIKEKTRYLTPIPPKTWMLLPLFQWAAFILGIVGMSMSRHDISAASTIIIAVLFVVQAGICLFLFSQSRQDKENKALIYVALFSTPFLAVRVLYGLLVTFAKGDAFGGTQPGAVALAALLQFLMEFVVICLFLYAGLVLFPPGRKSRTRLTCS